MPKALEIYLRRKEQEREKVVLQYPDFLEVRFPPEVDAALKKGTPYSEITFLNTSLGRFLLRYKATFQFVRDNPSIQRDVWELNQVELARKKAEEYSVNVWNAPHIALVEAEHSLEKTIINNKKQNGVSGISREDSTWQELRETRRQAATHRKELRCRTRELREQERRMNDHLQLKVEGMITCDPKGIDNVLGYVLSNPSRRRNVFAQFSDNFQNPELAIKQLEDRYFKLKHQR